MSLLPQRKKSADEIAKIREGLGIPGNLPVEEVLPAETPIVETEPDAAIPNVSNVVPAAELEVAEESQLSGDVPAASRHLTAPAAKLVRSLRKSEQIPLYQNQRPSPPRDSKLPAQRRSDDEIARMRRQEAIAMQTQAPHLPPMAAHLAVLILGYLFAIAGAVSFYFYDLEIRITTGCVAAALLIAAFISIRKPLSRHHAAFIAVISLFVLAFGALHYFPQLRYGS